ncbi:hypothetical protein FOF52_21655 [Thermobifida alba]|uniref:Uncharacterized protein n=1 Tax=Thermobifida alba TaxID=53522 RepID=A0ABY4L740_THEAE|nr:DUF6082 family protein [Thermobifida alba]UPT23229.1 hypothetical protein FOF52_21655 [Thermobifida alba]
MSPLSAALEDQLRSSEVALRQIHTDLVKTAIDDEELLQVWPDLYPGVGENRRDRYCNLVLNLQKVAYETRTIELDELRGALRRLMTGPHMYAFWAKARQARIAVTGGDEAEDFIGSDRHGLGPGGIAGGRTWPQDQDHRIWDDVVSLCRLAGHSGWCRGMPRIPGLS